MSEIKLVNVERLNCRYLNLKIRDGELYVVMGPTGAGKTTLLNIIAGLVDYTGSVLIDGADVNKLSPRERGVGYLFQELALFPNLTVERNISFGLKARGYDKITTMERASFLMELMRIEHLSGRYPQTLSGGEKKKVALARSLAPFPRILLLDEPTSSLDQNTAKELRAELHSILKKLGTTTVYVTHDLLGVAEIADRVAFMSNGIIEHEDDPPMYFVDYEDEYVSELIRSLPLHAKFGLI